MHRTGRIKTILGKIDIDQRNMKTLLTLLLLKLIPVKLIRRYGHVMRGDINFQICEIYGSWNNWEKEEGSTKESGGRVRKEGFGTIWLEKVRTIKRNGESELEQKLRTPTSQDNGIKTDVVVVVDSFS